MQVTHANLLLRSSPAHYRTYQRDPKVHQPGWPAGWTSRPRMRRRRATGRVTGDRGAGDADTTDTTAPAACDAPRGRGSAIGTVGADQSRGGGRRRSVIGDEGGIGMHAEGANAGAGATRARRGERGETGGAPAGLCRTQGAHRNRISARAASGTAAEIRSCSIGW